MNRLLDDSGHVNERRRGRFPPMGSVSPRTRRTRSGLRRTAPTVMAIVLAGGQGVRLRPLTLDRAKPALPFGGTFRLIDFVMSNLANAGYTEIAVLTEYQHRELDRHIARAWGHLAYAIPAEVSPLDRSGRHPGGTAGAVHTIVPLIEAAAPDVVCVFGADHVYRMDPTQLVNDHVESGAGATVVGVRVPRRCASAFGVIDPGPNTSVAGFVEKAAHPPSLPGEESTCLASMGNYAFDRDLLVEILNRDANDRFSRHDFGGDVLPHLAAEGRLRYHDFGRNRVVGQPESEVGYWRDVGTVDAYHAAHMDLIGPEPRFSLQNRSWPTRPCRPTHPSATTIDLTDHHTGLLIDSLVCPGSVVAGGRAVRSVIGPQSRLDRGADLAEVVLLDGVRVGAGAVIRRTVIDTGVTIPAAEHIGVDPESDRARFTVSDHGIVVVPRSYDFSSGPLRTRSMSGPSSLLGS